VSNIIPINGDKGIGVGNGLDYGLDFAGGIRLHLKLEKEVSAETMAVEKQILQDRLNALGLKDIRIIPLMRRYILIEVVNASAQDMKQIEEILKKQASFEARIDGKLAIKGDEVTVDLSPQGSLATPTQPSNWFVAIKNSIPGGERFCEVGKGKIGEPIDMFLDRPSDALILMPNSTFFILEEINDDYRDSIIDIIERRAVIPIYVMENEGLNISKLIQYNKSTVIVAASTEQFSENLVNILEENNFSVERKEKGEKSYTEWIFKIIGLQSSPRLNCDPCTECKYSAQITGQAPTLEDARREVKKNQVLLSSGNLPAKVEISRKSELSPVIGEIFLHYSFLIGVIGIITVALVIFLRYRKLFIVLPIIFVGLSEVLIILGFASIVPVGGKLGWEIDLAAIAGIIAAVGTGVDDQIIITDETIKKEKERKKVTSIVERIRRAFFIIFTAAATTIGVMVPIFTIQDLRGFAFTTVVGVLIGVFITRPAYAKIIEELLEE
jgi:preprotein translocase subunit SecD